MVLCGDEDSAFQFGRLWSLLEVNQGTPDMLLAELADGGCRGLHRDLRIRGAGKDDRCTGPRFSYPDQFAEAASRVHCGRNVNNRVIATAETSDSEHLLIEHEIN